MSLKSLLCASALAALALTLLPEPALAQRRAVRVQRPPAVVVRAYPGIYYDPWYSWGWYGPSPYYYGQRYYYDSASVHIQVTPKTAEVYVDGYLAGTVDEFDGAFQRLRVEPGEHEIAVWADGFRTLRRRVYIQPLSTVNIKETLDPLQTGDVQEARPAASTTSAPPAPRRTGGPVTRSGGRADTRRAPAPESGTQSAREATFGVLSVRVQPGGADVLIDGERWEGPEGDERLLVQLAPGQHRLEVRRDGYQTFSRSVDIRAGATETINVSLSRP